MEQISDILDIQGHNSGLKIFSHGITGYTLLAIGCSWTRGWGSQDHDLHSNDPKRVDDIDFMRNQSFAGLVSNHLGCSSLINLAIPGSNNQMQTRLLIECIERNKKSLGKIFVLWGVTSHLRWELWSTIVDKPTMFMLGSDYPTHKQDEREWWMKYHFNESFELAKLSQKILTIHGYLKNLGIEHLFFPSFVSYNKHNMLLSSIDDRYFFNVNEPVNDMMSLMFQCIAHPKPKNWISNPYNDEDNIKISALQHAGLMSKLAHPNISGHKFIAEKLIEFIELMS